MNDVMERMREDWNRRAKEDARFYVAFARRQQDEEEFFATAAEQIREFQKEFVRMAPGPGGLEPSGERRALEIGCGPGRLLLPMSRFFGEIHGVDISEEMAAMAREKLRDVPNAHVHVNAGSALEMLGDDYFDYVYSFTVFQHIPDKQVVLSYLREAQRVLKPGGVLYCQVRGLEPMESERKPGLETWTGCWFEEDEMVRFAREQGFRLVTLWGAQTQYLWTCYQKRNPAKELGAATDRIVVKDVTAAADGGRQVPARGPGAAVSLWISGFPANGDLSGFPVSFGGVLRIGCYLSNIDETGACQMNALLPVGTVLGVVRVGLTADGEPVGDTYEIEVVAAPPYAPRVTQVTDNTNLLAQYRVENDGLRVTIEDLGNPETVSFLIGDASPEYVLVECRDPITSRYEFTFPMPPNPHKGAWAIAVRVGEELLHTVTVEVV